MRDFLRLCQRLEALAYRERQTRFSGGWIGPYWAQVTPVIWIAFLVYLFQFLERSPPIDVSTAVFVATGVLPYVLFRQMITSLTRTTIANRHLKNIRPVDHNELLIATGILEGWNFVLTTALICGTLVIAGFSAPPANPFGYALALCLLFCLSCGLGRLIATIGLMSDTWARTFPIMLRPLFWVSGIFYTATELSSAAQGLLWYNPLFHIIELARSSYFETYVSPLAEVYYPILISCMLFLCSLAIEDRANSPKMIRFRL